MEIEIKNYKEGMKITEPCIIRGMPNEIYHKYPALSNSGLKTLIKCPAKYYYKYISGEYEPKEKPYFKIGKAAHKYILEGKEEFEKEYWHNPYSEMKKDELIELLMTFGYEQQNVKKLLVGELMELILKEANIEPKAIHLTASELNQVVCMARSIKADLKANNALSKKGESELSIFWQDEKTGVWLKCRPDYLPYDCVNVPDYKTAESADPETFFNSFIKYGYHVQAAMYRMGIKAVTGIDVKNFFFIVQEKEPPYVTQIFNPDVEHLIVWGEKAIYSGIEKYLECKERGIWAGYSERIIELRIEPSPEEVIGNYDKENGIIYAPKWIDNELMKYEA